MNITKVPCWAFIRALPETGEQAGKPVQVHRVASPLGFVFEKNGIRYGQCGMRRYEVEFSRPVAHKGFATSAHHIVKDCYLIEIKGGDKAEDTETEAPIEHGVAE